MRRLELVLSIYNNMQMTLLTGIFFILYGLLFLEGSIITIFLFASGLYVFGIMILAFLFTVLIIGGFKMRKYNKEVKKLKLKLKEIM